MHAFLRMMKADALVLGTLARDQQEVLQRVCEQVQGHSYVERWDPDYDSCRPWYHCIHCGFATRCPPAGFHSAP
jgi:hypothetical protein